MGDTLLDVFWFYFTVNLFAFFDFLSAAIFHRTRMGQVVLLNMGMKSEPAAGVVLTLFPVGKKPKPCAQRIPLTHVKSFRATILEEREFGDDVMLVPSTNTWRYSQEHVLAILDVKDETDLAQGKIFLTPESWQVLERLRLSQSYLTRRTRSESRNP